MPKKIIGTVLSNAPDRTAKVEVYRYFVHPKYLKIVKRRSTFLCHDHHNICNVGDVVQIIPCKRVSKHKNFAIVDMIHRFPQLDGEKTEFAHSLGPQVIAAAQAAVNPTVEAATAAK